MFSDSQIVVFHTRDLNWGQLPMNRSADQYFVFMLWESPYHSDYSRISQTDAWKQSYFNLSLTYRRDSDIFAPYGVFKPRVSPLGVDLEELAKNKTDMAVWMVSHCQTPSKREEVVRKLQKFIPVDVFGWCGNGTCAKHATTSRNLSTCGHIDYFDRKYKFYMALENSLCLDYVTEKLFQHMQQYLVPVVLERENYIHLCPEYKKPWFIAVNDFKTIKELSEYLKYLDNNITAYMEYLSWHEHYESFLNIQSDIGFMTSDHWFELCHVVAELKNRSMVKNVYNWWNNGTCKGGDWKTY